MPLRGERGARPSLPGLAHPARPLTREQHLAKFHRCLSFSAEPLASGAAAQLIDTMDRLEEMTDVIARAAEEILQKLLAEYEGSSA